MTPTTTCPHCGQQIALPISWRRRATDETGRAVMRASMLPQDHRCPKEAPQVSDDIRDLIERGSFGTPEAKRLRESVSDEDVARVLRRVRELEQEQDQ